MPTPAGLYVPGEQSLGGIGMEPFMHERPAGQTWQADAPPALYLPSGHFCWKKASNVKLLELIIRPSPHFARGIRKQRFQSENASNVFRPCYAREN